MFKIPKQFHGIKRFEQVLGVVTKYELGYFLEKAKLKKRKLRLKKKQSRPVELRMIFEELGGTFIKLGQLLSLRPDLIPKEYCDELSKLQDDVEPFPYEEVNHVIKAELKKPVSKLFKSFNKVPVAAASIGQVHVARLKTGKKVAVKVMRPGVKALIETDLMILEYLARVFKHHVKQDIIEPEEIFAEFKRYSKNELDYLKEAQNIKKFYANFKNDKKIKIPKVYDKLTTHKVLTMEFIEGVKVSQILRNPKKHKRINKKKVSELIIQSVLKQIFIDGFFHADPHPANLIVKNNVLGFIDFGIIGKLDKELKQKLGYLFISLIHRNADEVVKSFISLNLVDSDVDVNGLKKDLGNTLGEYYDTRLDKIDMVDLFFKSLRIAKKHKVKIPRDFVLLGKALVTLQGVGIELNPGFNLVKETKPFIDKLAKQRTKPSYVARRLFQETERFAEFVQTLPDESKKVYKTIEKADTALEEINTDIKTLTLEIRRETWRVIMGILIAALIIGVSLTYRTDAWLSNLFLILAFIILAYLLFSILRDGFRRKKW
ncbi:AarF/ABC1/UbiB kinase family protein [Candidatus Woesearchaeota archaeon]|nr:AarF/ABC1/UbiB kinase family protein [Candidatus Woesearchaeota archaeon]